MNEVQALIGRSRRLTEIYDEAKFIRNKGRFNPAEWNAPAADMGFKARIDQALANAEDVFLRTPEARTQVHAEFKRVLGL